MSMQFGCGDVMQGCKFVVNAENEQELLQQVAAHAASAHGVTEVTPELIAKVRAAVKQVPAK